MSRYRKVDPRIWNDAKFRALGNHAKLVFFMLLTHPNMTALGAMRATVAGLSEELGWPVDSFRKAFEEVLAQGLAEHSGEACFVALPNFIKYNPPESPNVIKAWVGALDLLPECDLKSKCLQRAKLFTEGLTEGFVKAFREAFAQAMPNQKQEPKQKKKRTPPTPSGGADGFNEFWEAWPAHQRKVAKDQCQAKWTKLGCGAIKARIVANVEALKASDKWRDEGGEYIPAPMTYLNQKRWEAQAFNGTGVPWTETRSGIVAKGLELGVGAWDEYAASVGKGESFKAYETRVKKAAGVETLRAA